MIYTVTFWKGPPSGIGRPAGRVSATVALRPREIVALSAVMKILKMRGEIAGFDIEPAGEMSQVVIGPDGRPWLPPWVMTPLLFLGGVLAHELHGGPYCRACGRPWPDHPRPDHAWDTPPVGGRRR